ncbi:class I SAM-dependent methyltransferase [Paludisphaera borealis]|uniref:Ubiquinone biosynthesis O-methyltransferase n=1 Tax=Paludisphaera borealis TaxID=1387353 RepID=A0A1U7CS21_9BACT|nr:class I SAM-dependent methyltransferase [Paludisphaera borealis]APW61735.1 Ubiquinone biosynthesis O-methyltransferase [Paludisphaera borealis]
MGVSLEQERVDAFGRKMVEALNHAGLALMASMGHRTGLFDVMSRLPAATSERIASEAVLSERYVREWLGAMATGGVVEYREGDGTYRLPPEHAAWLTRESSPNNVAAAMQFVAVLGYVEDQVVEAFRHGRGVPYSAYHRFHEVMAEESAQTVVAALAEQILPLVPGLVDRLAGGIDVLDVGCGSGRAVNELAANFPKSRFAGYDFAEEAIVAARREAERRGLSNARFEVRDVAEMGESAAYDLITAFDAIHDQARPDAVLRNIAEALRPGGTFLMQDISGSSHVHTDLAHPLGPFLYTISCMHCMSVSLACGGPGLGAMWGKEKALQMLREAGFGPARVERLPHDPMNYFYIAAPDS